MINEEDVRELKKFERRFTGRRSIHLAIDRLEDLGKKELPDGLREEIREISSFLKALQVEGMGLTSQYVKIFHDVIPRLLDPTFTPSKVPNPPSHFFVLGE